MKRIMQLIVMVCSLFILTASCFAAASVVDNARLLSNAEAQAVTKTINEMEKKYNVRAAFVTMKDSKVTDLGKYTNSILDKNYRDGKNGNMVMIINMANGKFYISTDNKMRTMISDSYGVKQIGNNVVAALKNKKYKDAIMTYASQTEKQLAYYAANKKAMEAPKTAVPSTKAVAGTKKAKEPNIPMAGAGAVVLGGIAAYLYGNSLKASMSNVANATQANQYMKEGSFRLTNSDDTFMYFTYARVPKAKASHNDNDDVEDHFTDDSTDDDHGGGGGSFDDGDDD